MSESMDGGVLPLMEEILAMAKMSKHPEYRILKHREVVFDSPGDQYCSEFECFVRASDELVTEFFESEKQNDGSYPAVDLASGSTAFAVAFAQRYRRPRFRGDLEWYLTDYNGTLPEEVPYFNETRVNLEFLAKEPSPLFADPKGKAVFVGDNVRLVGLKKKEFNGRIGLVHGCDPNNKDRFGVTFEDKDTLTLKKISLKPINIERDCKRMGDDGTGGINFVEAERCIDERRALFDGLLDRACPTLDILKEETWSNLDAVEGKCALVTCSNLLNCMGYRAPQAWMNCLELASKLLAPGGFFVMYDAINLGGYGDIEEMDRFISSKSLSLKPRIQSRPMGTKMVRQLFSWQRKG